MKLSPLPLLLALALAALIPSVWAATATTPTRRPEAGPVAAAPQSAATPESLLEQSREAQARGEADLAVRLAQAAIVADPARPASYVALGDLYAAAGQSEFARSYYEAALEIDPSDSGAKRGVAALANAKATAANNP